MKPLSPQDRETLIRAAVLCAHPELVRHHYNGVCTTVDARNQHRPLRAPDYHLFVEMQLSSDMPVLVLIRDPEAPK